MCSPCLHLTSSDEYVHAVGQYVELFATTPKSGGKGKKGKGFVLSLFHHQWKSKANSM